MVKCKPYKVWKGGISMDGTAYTGKKEIQPTSWGMEYLSDSTQNFTWTAKLDGKALPISMQSRGYVFRKNQIYLQHELILGSDTIKIEERPEFVKNKAGKPGLERIFVTKHVPPNVSIALKSTSGKSGTGTERSIAAHGLLRKATRPDAARRPKSIRAQRRGIDRTKRLSDLPRIVRRERRAVVSAGIRALCQEQRECGHAYRQDQERRYRYLGERYDERPSGPGCKRDRDDPGFYFYHQTQGTNH